MSPLVKAFTCIRCPMGCPLRVTIDGDEVVSVEGNTCKRGKTYAFQEAIHPMRTVTSLVTITGCAMPVSCKTTDPVPEERVFDVLDEIALLRLDPPVHLGDVICENVCDTGANVVATKDVLR